MKWIAQIKQSSNFNQLQKLNIKELSWQNVNFTINKAD